MQYDIVTEEREARRETHGVSRRDLGPVAGERGLISGPSYGERAVLTAEGDVRAGVAEALSSALRDLDPEETPLLTIDLQRASSLEPLVIHRVFHDLALRQPDRAFALATRLHTIVLLVSALAIGAGVLGAHGGLP